MKIASESHFRAPMASALIALLLCLPGAAPWLEAQDAASTIAVDVKVVALPVTVRDKHGKIVRDLTKDDFTLQEDGRPQTIKYFSQDANLPLTLGLLVDTSRSQTNVLEAERNASRSFIEQMLAQPKDKAFLIHFDREVELLQDLTSSREKLQAALELLKTSSDRERSNDPNEMAMAMAMTPTKVAMIRAPSREVVRVTAAAPNSTMPCFSPPTN